MADLRTDYKDDLLDTSVNTQRKYRMVTNDDGTVSFEDATVYTQNGDTFGASEVNQIHAAVNLVNESLTLDFSKLSEDVQDVNTLLQKLGERFYPSGFDLNAQPSTFFTSISSGSSVNPIILHPTGSANGVVSISNIDLTEYKTMTITAISTNGALAVYINSGGANNEVLSLADGVINNTSKTFTIDISAYGSNCAIAFNSQWNLGDVQFTQCILH